MDTIGQVRPPPLTCVPAAFSTPHPRPPIPQRTSLTLCYVLCPPPLSLHLSKEQKLPSRTALETHLVKAKKLVTQQQPTATALLDAEQSLSDSSLVLSLTHSSFTHSSPYRGGVVGLPSTASGVVADYSAVLLCLHNHHLLPYPDIRRQLTL